MQNVCFPEINFENRNHMTNHLVEILTSLSRSGVKYIVCGGVAAVLHGVERMTMDIDLAIDFKRENLSKLIEVFKTIHLKPRIPVPPEILLDKDARKMMVNEKNAMVFTFIDLENPYRQVDIFLTEEFDYNILKNETEKMTIDGHEILIISLEKLITMKKSIIPLRDKDRSDITLLERIMVKRNSDG
jgi:predicted nucleotidyltransferase